MSDRTDPENESETQSPGEQPTTVQPSSDHATLGSQPDDRPPQDPPTSDQSSRGQLREDSGPGWMPAILAATVLMGIIGFVVCAFSTWVLFQKRTELAIRTLRGSYISQIEQSLLEPAAKSGVVSEIETLADEMERGKYEDWQSAAIMQRLQRLPVLQWGELQSIIASVRKLSGEERSLQRKQFTRLQRAVELGKVTSFDFEDVLQPARVADPGSPFGHRLMQPLTEEAIAEVVVRSRLVADRENVPDQTFGSVSIESIVRREIERGATSGSF